jgi:hypothetical protein
VVIELSNNTFFVTRHTEDMSTLRVFQQLQFEAANSTKVLHVGDVVKLNLPAKKSTSKTKAVKKAVVIGEILGFIRFVQLQPGELFSYGQGKVWYREVPESVFGSKIDTQHVVNTTCLNLDKCDDFLATPAELEAIQNLAPCFMRVEILHRPHADRNIRSAAASSPGYDDDEDIEEEKRGGDSVKTKEHFKKEYVQDVSKKKGFSLFAAEPVDIVISVHSESKKLVFHRPNQPNKKYSVHVWTDSKDYGKSKSSALYTKVMDSAKSVSFDLYTSETKLSEKTTVVHYFNKIQFMRSDAKAMTLHVDVLDGDRVVLNKTFIVKVSPLIPVCDELIILNCHVTCAFCWRFRSQLAS